MTRTKKMCTISQNLQKLTYFHLFKSLSCSIVVLIELIRLSGETMSTAIKCHLKNVLKFFFFVFFFSLCFWLKRLHSLNWFQCQNIFCLRCLFNFFSLVPFAPTMYIGIKRIRFYAFRVFIFVRFAIFVKLFQTDS